VNKLMRCIECDAYGHFKCTEESKSQKIKLTFNVENNLDEFIREGGDNIPNTDEDFDSTIEKHSKKRDRKLKRKKKEKKKRHRRLSNSNLVIPTTSEDEESSESVASSDENEQPSSKRKLGPESPTKEKLQCVQCAGFHDISEC
jgi:hypothetical protein